VVQIAAGEHCKLRAGMFAREGDRVGVPEAPLAIVITEPTLGGVIAEQPCPCLTVRSIAGASWEGRASTAWMTIVPFEDLAAHDEVAHSSFTRASVAT
jgi:hypothetical protein